MLTTHKSKAISRSLADAVNAALEKKGVSARKASLDVVGHDGLIRDIRAGRIPSYDRVKALFEYLEIDPSGDARDTFISHKWADQLLPHLGMAKCSIDGWADDYRDRDPLPRPAWIEDDKAFWIMATGQSMEREGIISGDYCLVSPARQPHLGDRVFIKDVVGKVAIKRLLDMDGRTAKLRGWQPIRDERQKEFLEERPLKMVKELFPVVAVYRGRPGNEKREPLFIPDPRAPELPRHDGIVLVEVMMESLVAGRQAGIPGTLGFHEKWLRSIGLLPENAALVAVKDQEMEPTFSTRSIGLINKALTRIEANSIYAIRRNKEVLLRRLEALPDGTLIIRGDSPAAKSSVLPSGRAGDVEVIGRVVWSGHHL
ncbi:hypothetical protein KX928_12805 [Roseobacter sp. YSTF-M11]|uniref:Peptidase S24/S26A/S26B/S26C domain-containing protein n=1 Tax=Roseobacter insulae TaxID=2859783 RepID=A0A9X1FVC0_9RHOB|nr:S24 family peptidase [Roseobacter insulae]MBW4708665.1 hypothetical protein [Roseobacter insulae]